jgi:AraC family transcriptional regulator, transcriptional activator FtrA
MRDNAAIMAEVPAEPAPARAAGPGSAAPESVAMVVYDGVAPFEVGVVCDVFGGDFAADFGVPWYRLTICAATPSVRLDIGPRMEVPAGLAAIRTAGTVVVMPTEQADRVPAAVLDELRAARRRGQRILSLCTGAFILAAAGILDGHRATTHWAECAQLAERYPQVTVDPDVLYVDEGDLLTSAGSAASIDLCLHVVQRDFGREVATRLARELVVPLHREGGQAQFIDTPIPVLDEQHLFADTLAWLQGHLDETVTVHDLADRAAMSSRTFARRFLASTGVTPYQWIVRERVRLAQRMLETTDLSIDAVAVKAGFCTAGNLRKHFSRTVRTSPHAYRDSFRAH